MLKCTVRATWNLLDDHPDGQPGIYKQGTMGRELEGDGGDCRVVPLFWERRHRGLFKNCMLGASFVLWAESNHRSELLFNSWPMISPSWVACGCIKSQFPEISTRNGRGYMMVWMPLDEVKPDRAREQRTQCLLHRQLCSCRFDTCHGPLIGDINTAPALAVVCRLLGVLHSRLLGCKRCTNLPHPRGSHAPPFRPAHPVGMHFSRRSPISPSEPRSPAVLIIRCRTLHRT